MKIKTISKRSLNTNVAILLMTTASVSLSSAQSLVNTVFGGDNGANNTTITASSFLGGDTETDSSIGPGWSGEVQIGLGVIYDVTMGINQGSTGAFTIAGSGVAGVLTNFEASKTFSGGDLNMAIMPNELYAVDLTISNAGLVSLLNGYNIGIEVGGVAVNNGTNTGLLGLADVLTLFGGTNTATLLFTTPGTIASQNLTFTSSGATTAGLLGETFTISQASIRQVNAVPEPSIAVLCSIGALLAFRRRR